MDALSFDSTGLLPAVAQDRFTGQVRMVAWMSADAVRQTLSSGNATFFSRSRGGLWTKGETSGHFLRVHKVLADCDNDTLLLQVEPVGPSCHTGRPSCFFREVGANGIRELPVEGESFLWVLERILRERQASTAEKSYTRSLLDAGAAKIGDKLREESDELARALASESDVRVTEEAADLIYHLLVGLRLRDISLEQVMKVLDARLGQSGHEEKARRSGPR